jgi:hypothetical protein
MLQAAGMDAWAFDFAGYGSSDRPRVFDQDATASPPFGQCEVAAGQVALVLQHIRHWLHLQPRREALWAEALSFTREETRAAVLHWPNQRPPVPARQNQK